jgi:hypothetical protein
MAASDLINLSGLLDDAKCFALVRQHRWPEGARCPVCGSGVVIRDGHDDAQPCPPGFVPGCFTKKQHLPC